MDQKLLNPVNPDTLIHAFESFTRAYVQFSEQAGSVLSMHTDNGDVELSDTPFNRGMIAAVQSLDGVERDPAVRTAILMRLSLMLELLRNADESPHDISSFVVQATEGDRRVNPALIRAVAQTTLEGQDSDALKLNLKECLELARRFAREPAPLA